MAEAEELNYLIREVLRLDSHPVAVRLIRQGEQVDGCDAAGKYRYCQALMVARHGGRVRLHGDNIACPAAAAAFGFRRLPEKLVSGEMLVNMGLFQNAEAAARTMTLIPRLLPGRYESVVVAPLAQADFEPHVVVMEGAPESLMWVLLASIYDTGGRLEFTTGVFQATCVDSTVVPFVTGKVNATLGCYGCREATDIAEDECLVGVPGGELSRIVENLKHLYGRAVRTARAKKVYQSFAGRREAGWQAG